MREGDMTWKYSERMNQVELSIEMKAAPATAATTAPDGRNA